MNDVVGNGSFNFRSLIHKMTDYVFVIFSIFFYVRLLFFFTNHSTEMLEQLLYSLLFEMLATNLFLSKYFFEKGNKIRLTLNRVLSVSTIILSIAGLYFVFQYHKTTIVAHFTSLGAFTTQSLICFSLLSLSLLYSSDRSNKLKIIVSQSMAIISLLLCIGSLSIHLFEVDLDKNFSNLSGLSMTSTLFFLVLSFGCLSINSDKELMGLIARRSNLSKIPQRMFLFSIFIPIILAWLRIHLEGTDDLYSSAMVFYIVVFMLCFGITSYLWYTTMKLDESNNENQLLHEKLTLSEQRLKLALHSANQGAWEYDFLQNSLALDANGKRLTNFTSTHDKIDFSDFTNLLTTESKLRLSLILHSEENKQINLDLQLTEESGSKWIRLLGKKFFDQHRLYVKVSGTLQDVTAEKEAQTALKSSMHDLKIEKELRERFIATLSHDLKNVMTVCLSYADLTRRHLDKPDLIAKYSHKTEASVNRGISMIRDLLDLSFFQQNGSFPIRSMSEVRMSDIFDGIKDSFPELHERLVISLTENFEATLSESDIKRVFENLIGNAKKYGSTNGLITINVDHSDDEIIFKVHNDGQIIPLDVQEHLFSYLGRSSQSQKVESWGIGLCIVKGIIEAHHGKIGVESKEGFGTTFTISLPSVFSA